MCFAQGQQRAGAEIVLGLAASGGLAIAGCATVAGHLPPPHPAPASGHFQAGVARVDITPARGFPADPAGEAVIVYAILVVRCA